MNHLERANHFINKISDLIAKFQWDFNTHEVRLQICNELKYLFNLEFDEYWQQISGLYPDELEFIDLTTPEIINQNQYYIGVVICGEKTIPFSDFIKEYFRIESVRDRKIKEILG